VTFRLLAWLMLAMVGACAPSVSDHDNRIFAMPASVKLVRSVQPAVTGVTLGAGNAELTVEASLHGETAAEVLKTVADGQRVTLKCFCEGFDQRVRLKSCVAPDLAR